jgi:hypothetical protein
MGNRSNSAPPIMRAWWEQRGPHVWQCTSFTVDIDAGNPAQGTACKP